MSTLQGVRLTEVSALQECLPYRGVCLTEVSALQTCLPYRGICLTEMSALQGCLPYRGVHLSGVSALQMCLPYRHVCLTGVSTLQGCLPYKGVHLTAGVSALQGVRLTVAGLDIGAHPLAQVSVKNCRASANHGSLARFGEYDFHIQNMLFKISVTFYFPL